MSRGFPNMTSALRNCIAALLLIGVATPPRQALVLSVDPARSTVHWSLESSLHTVHGTFHVQRGTVAVDPATGKASGEIVVDATPGESGNNGRDRKMHNEILESSQYSEVGFRPDRAAETIVSQGKSSSKLHGIFSLHGADHELSVHYPSSAKRRSVEGDGKFRSSLYRVGFEKS
jgi:hypothetical protein